MGEVLVLQQAKNIMNTGKRKKEVKNEIYIYTVMRHFTLHNLYPKQFTIIAFTVYEGPFHYLAKGHFGMGWESSF